NFILFQDQVGDMKHDNASSPGISDQEKEMATNAFEAFTAGNYDDSLKQLESLQELNKEDYKIALNKAVAEFYKSGQATTGTLKQTLMTIKNQVHTAVEDIDGLDDVENSILYYNQAIIHYHMRQYSEAISIGEKLYQFLEPFEEKFAQAVCFLLVDLYLLTFQPEKALHLLAVLEKLSSIVGQGYHRKIVLASQSTQNTTYSEGQSAAIPVASMEFAAICLRNALLLLPEHQQHDSKPDNGSKSSSQSGSTESGSENSDACSGKGQEGDKFIPAAPSSPLRKQEVENLRCCILACSAYVALALGDNLMALNHADKLLHQPKLSGSLKFLGHLYAAEALISLDRISDAIAHLNPENVTDVSLGVSPSEQDQGSDKGDLEPVESSGKQTPLCYPSTVSSARAMMLFNLGSAYCLRSEYEKARKCLHQAASMVNPKEIPPEAILLGVYLELQNGNTQLALQIIKRNQLLPSVKPSSSPDLRKKPPPFQPAQPIQPIQMPSSFTQVQRK
uniref:CCR4-NOT transcription complex subunit 10 n=1 Tax=Astyanax mexicanus TaxID=7994 RepID=A0A8B9K224_ASTMX